jgi:two-component system CheB/CheR fusion protein
MLLKDLVPPTVIVTDRGRVVHIHGRTGSFLEPAPGAQAGANIFDMAREGLEVSLSAAIRQAATSGEEIVHPRLRVGTDGDEVVVTLRVLKLKKPEPLRGLFRITFERAEPREGAAATSQASNVLERQDLERELRYAREGHQAVVEELETANEELQSANEELQSTNEELQSTNEELGTSREEIQSVNEELQTVNTELQNKVAQLWHANDDLKNLLNATDIATVFIDNDLSVKRYTDRALSLFRLIPTDVGRPLSDLVSSLRYDALVEDSREVLRTLIPREAEILAVDGRRYLMRILPYRTNDNRIDGLVLTFVDVTMMKTLEEEHARLLEALQGSPVTVYGQDASLVIGWAAGPVFGKAAAEVIGKSDRDLFVAEDMANIDAIKRVVLATGEPKTARARIAGDQRLCELHIAPARDATGSIGGLTCVAVELPTATAPN